MTLQILTFLTIFGSIVLGWSYMMLRVIVVLFPIITRGHFVYGIGLFGVVCFIIGMLGANSFPHPIFSTLYKYGAIWLGGITIAGFIATAMLIMSSIAHITYSHIAYLFGFIGVSAGIIGYSLYASFVPKIQEYTIEIHKNHHWHGKKIVMIADTHYGNIYNQEDARKLVQQINTQSGDIVIIPGDFYDGPMIDFEKVANEFREIKAPHGILFANGNHEEYRNTEAMIAALKQANITILNNQKTEINGMIFAGVTYHTTESAEGLTETLKNLNLDTNKPTILLKHKPTLHTILGKNSIDLMVSGHTHRGQMWPFSYITDYIYGKYSYGMSKDGNMTSITTSGVGSWGPPERLGTRSEIVVITIQ